MPNMSPKKAPMPSQDPNVRNKNFLEVATGYTEEVAIEEAQRCLNCKHKPCVSGCPVHISIPDFIKEVAQGNFSGAYDVISKSSSLPAVCGRVCPQETQCELKCVRGIKTEPVGIGRLERFVADWHNAQTDVVVNKPEPNGHKVAVVGSGPAGLAVADQLNQRGHSVTVYERADRIGGLLRYGIPNMKLEKHIIDRKLDIMKEEGIEFVTNANVGENIKAKKLMADYDAVVLACGAANPRDINAPGRDANGIYFAVDFLTATTKSLLDSGLKDGRYISAKDKNVIVIGGGDTGNDCVGTCIRHGCKSVTQLEMMPKAPDERAENNPWPQWPLVCKTDYGQEEAIAVFGHDPRIYTTTVKEFKKDKKGNLTSVVTVKLESKTDEKTGRRMMVPVEGTEAELPCELVLIAAGFLGSQKYVTDAFGVELTERTNVKTAEDGFETSVPGVFTAGDMHTGQSLVVKAIRQGRDCARAVDYYLMGYTNL